MKMEPLHFLTFPILHGVSTPGGSSPGSRQSGAAGGKAVSLLWKGKLSPGRREGEPEHRPSHLWSSPWHTAPLHLPLVGQNCWPHMAPGFSASLWLRVTELEEKSDDKGWDSLMLDLLERWTIYKICFIFQKKVSVLHLRSIMLHFRLEQSQQKKTSFMFSPWAPRRWCFKCGQTSPKALSPSGEDEGFMCRISCYFYFLSLLIPKWVKFKDNIS